jgi:hypothetical protein
VGRQHLPKTKGLSRIDEPGGHGVGWYARVKFRGKTHSRYFADGAHNGKMNAFKKAVAWRNAKERELGKPRTDRVVPSGRKSGRGVVGVYQSKKSYVVAWSPSPGTVRRAFVSISRYGRAEALRRAVELRRRHERAIYGGAITSTKPSPGKPRASKR